MRALRAANFVAANVVSGRSRLASLSFPLLLCGLVPLGHARAAGSAAADKIAPADKAAAKAPAKSVGKTVTAGKTPAVPADKTAPAASPPTATSYDELVKDAVPAKDLATLLEPLYARCDEKDDLHRRQCEGARTYLLEYLRGHTFVAEADVPPDTSPYDAAAKQVDMEVSGCLACSEPIKIAGEPRFLTTRPPGRVVNGRAVTMPVASHEVHLEDRTKADRFVERVVPRLRVQHVFRVGVPFGDGPAAESTAGKEKGATAQAVPAAGSAGAIKGVLISSLGHRVYDRCTGDVHAASPGTASRVAVNPDPRDPACPKKGGQELSVAEMKKAAEFAALPERLTPRQIDSVLAPVQARIHECFTEFGEPSGVAKVALTIGGEGKLTQISLPSPFDKADIGVCMRSQLKQASFPKFRGTPMAVDYVYQVQ